MDGFELKSTQIVTWDEAVRRPKKHFYIMHKNGQSTTCDLIFKA